MNKPIISIVGAFGIVSSISAAPFNPVPLTPESFNADMIVETGAPLPLTTGITATLDGGLSRNGFTWHEVGYNSTAPLTGIPAAGTTFTHASDATKSYSMPASYTVANNLFLSNEVTSGSLTLSSPATLTGLSLLMASGGGACNMNYVVTHADTTTESGTISAPDWFNGASPAYVTNGRINPSGGNFDSTNNALPTNGNPRLYSREVTFSNASPVVSITLTYTSGGRGSILAMSGSSNSGATYTPLAITGFNHDSVMGVADPAPTALTGYTTASMDGGTANTGNSWYQKGYNPLAPTTGLPGPGETITSAFLLDHHYQMPASYSLNNVIYVDSATSPRTITFATPENYSALSFLNATANGNVTIECTMHYEDNTTEVQTFVAKDWFNNSPVAYNAQGRVNLSNKTVNNVNNNNPRLYEAEFVLSNNASKITSVDLAFLSGNANARVAILAVSATQGALAPVYGTLPVSQTVMQGNALNFFATITGGAEPITYQWQKLVGSDWVNLTNGGNVSGADSTDLLIENAALTDVGSYRLQASNAVGTATTLVVTSRVRSSLPDVTSPYDAVVAIGGGSPGGEAITNLFNNNTSKTLIYGVGPVPQGNPYVGPVGCTLNPAVGSCLVQGIRLYTANDTEGRDPTDYLIEGSNDGGETYTTISSGSLSLPAERNGGGATLNPISQNVYELIFANSTWYSSYRLQFTNVKDPNGVNSMQLAEVELLGNYTPRLSISRDGITGDVSVKSNCLGVLQSSLTMGGDEPVWTNVNTIDAGNPFVFSIDPAEPKKFFRLILE